MIKNACLALCIVCFQFGFSQTKNKEDIPKPKLIVGLVIDQMRWDYLYRYYDLYSSNGFKRLLNEGFSCENTFVPYVPTYTAPGHTCIYTGSIPAIDGIVGNNWFDKRTNKYVYCTDDSTVFPVGGGTDIWGKMSPRNMWTTTIGDELRLSNNFKSKVFGISLKDRASILPAGHSANAAYWYDEAKGKFITSTYYMKELPAWLQNFNDKSYPDNYMLRDWNTLLPIEKYIQSTEDNKDYEQSYENKIPEATSVTFPHKLSGIITKKYEAFKYTPFAVTYTFDLAKSLIENEKLGTNAVSDLLSINIASTDFVGHSYGPNSIEIEDIFLRLDNDIAGFLQYLDNRIGKGNYLLFLTADHGVAHNAKFLKENNIPGGVFREGDLKNEINQLLQKKFNIKNEVAYIINYQVYLNKDETVSEKSFADIKETVINYLMEKSYVTHAFETNKIASSSIPEVIKQMLINGYNPKRSGDIHFLIKPNYFERDSSGSTHGLWNPYDAHIPLIWYGWKIKKGSSHRQMYMTDIAPTIAAMLKIQMPSGNIGKVIEEIIK